nr:MAG TPA: hypothetical protein [Caudoviricetes sp.]
MYTAMNSKSLLRTISGTCHLVNVVWLSHK